ncbi:hypothetical protein BMF94_5617 [Rhodotorula taiwanensis]|uniref:YDG domain-containing protein n=1 Tax=Rhodotorula taiwanensis TaxID=741276 RepID=A0A2S5B3I6_9BASI|nr:hypothetical protein BMF94_5617 [Rhodotorula taiwanensis]
MTFDFAAFRDAAEAKNASMLTGLDIRGVKAVIDEHAPPVVRKPKAKRPSVPKPVAARVVDDEADERERRGLRSSSRIKDQLTGSKATPTPSAASSGPFIDDEGEEEAYYYENGQATAMPGIPVGSIFQSRLDASQASIHAPPVTGIATGKVIGEKAACASICVSGGYVGDVDLGERLTFSGAGGRDLRGTKAQPKNLRTAPQSCDQTWETALNSALRRSVDLGKPIRVLRGFANKGPFAPVTGYRYDGLYQAVRAFEDTSEDGLLICRVALVRLPGQPPLPVHPDREHMLQGTTLPTSVDDSTSGAMSRTSSSSSSAQSVSTKATTPEREDAEESAPKPEEDPSGPSPKRRRVSQRTR